MNDAVAAFTVAICTRDRADHLRRCLTGLASQQTRYDVPLLVVDNDSTDGTRSVLAEFSDALAPRVIREPQVGLSHARNAAVAACTTDSYSWKRSFTYGRQLGRIDPTAQLREDASCVRTLWQRNFGVPLAARCVRDSLMGREPRKTHAADWMGRFAIRFGAAYERRAL